MDYDEWGRNMVSISWCETKSYTMIAEVIRKVQDPYIVKCST